MTIPDMVRQVQDEANRLCQDVLDLWQPGGTEEALAQVMCQLVPGWTAEEAAEVIRRAKAGMETGDEMYERYAAEQAQGMTVRERICRGLDQYCNNDDEKQGVLYAGRMQLMDALGMEDSEEQRQAYTALTLEKKIDFVLELLQKQTGETQSCLIQEVAERAESGVDAMDTGHSQQEKLLALTVCTHAQLRDADPEVRGFEEVRPEELGCSTAIAAKAGEEINAAVREDGVDTEIIEACIVAAVGAAAFLLTAAWCFPVVIEGAGNLVTGVAMTGFGIVAHSLAYLGAVALGFVTCAGAAVGFTVIAYAAVEAINEQIAENEPKPVTNRVVEGTVEVNRPVNRNYRVNEKGYEA